MNMIKGFVAQIEGFTSPAGNSATIQNWWNDLKSKYNFAGKELKFYACEFNSEVFTVTNTTPVKKLIVA